MSQVKQYFDYRITPVSLIGIIFLILTLTLGWLLPAEFSKENGIIENAQVVILGLGTFIALSALFQPDLPLLRRKLFACSAYIYLLAIGRELSWGRVFLTDSMGKIPSLKEVWFGPYLHPLIALITIAVLVYFFKTGLHLELVKWLNDYKLPLVDIVLIVIAGLLASASERDSFELLGSKHVLFEELFETLVYLSVVSFTYNVTHFEKKQRVMQYFR